MKMVNGWSFAALISFVLFVLSFTVNANALQMTNNQYIIKSEVNYQDEPGAFKKSSGINSSPNYYSGKNYTVKAGFQYLASDTPFSFSISSTNINYGTLIPGEPVTRNNNLIISAGSTTGYQVIVEENHPLRDTTTVFEIPDTSCDAGDCSDTQASVWISPLTYGFGHRCDNVLGSDCNLSFATSDFYKQFPNLEAGDPSQNIMNSPSPRGKAEIEATYKVNIPATQAKVIYQNIIKYIASPSV